MKRNSITLKFPNHMQDMIQYRGVNIDHVRLAIREPDCTQEVFQGRIKACKKIDEGRAMQVVYYKDGFRDTNEFIVITAYYVPNC